MYIDIHTHSVYKEKDVLIIQNLFPDEVYNISKNNFYSVGLHPWYVKKESLPADILAIKEVCPAKNVIAIGEAGIDKLKEIPVELQIEAFNKQIELSIWYKKPMVIHCVKAYNELLEIRNKSGTKIPWIIHWFNASYEIAQELIRKNCYLSYGIMLFKNNSKAYEAYVKLPLENLFFETDDAGYSIRQVYSKAAKLKNKSVEELQSQIISNFKTCFGNIL